MEKTHFVYPMRVFKVNTERIPGRRNRKQRHEVSQISLFQVLHVQRDDLSGTKYHFETFFSLSTIEKKVNTNGKVKRKIGFLKMQSVS